MEVDPAELRFTQKAIALYFQPPHAHFSIREAVRGLFSNEMSAEVFPQIRVIAYEGHWWSVDNRRLWVFRVSRCSSITVRVVTAMQPRVRRLFSDSEMCSMMKAAEFLPRVRDRGQQDPTFDRLFLAPSHADASDSDGLDLFFDYDLW